MSTEGANLATEGLSEMDAVQAVDSMIEADRGIIDVLRGARVEIAAAVDLIAERLGAGGRLFFMGAGTSGRLGMLDAAECPPTFMSDPEQVQGVLAGGQRAMLRAVEGAEDNPKAAGVELGLRGLAAGDVVVGISASGTTPFVHGGLEYAASVGAGTVLLACVSADEISDSAQVSIRIPTGAESLAGSTRLRAGTATKMVLNMLSTLSMARLGKVHGNLMVDVDTSSNAKLVRRGEDLVRQLVPVQASEAQLLLQAAGGRVKLAVVMGRFGIDRKAAQARLDLARGFLGQALNQP